MDSMDSEEHYNSAEQPFASNHLRIVEIECEEVNMWVCEILKTLSTYGIPLKQISVKKTSGRRGSGCELIYRHLSCFFCFLKKSVNKLKNQVVKKNI